jgi:hypothetical protein
MSKREVQLAKRKSRSRAGRVAFSFIAASLSLLRPACLVVLIGKYLTCVSRRDKS